MNIEAYDIDSLRKLVRSLQSENTTLKAQLQKANIPYEDYSHFEEKIETLENYDPDQGERIINPEYITDDMAKRYFAMFWGRQDVYAKRSVNKETGKVAYYPQCSNFWTNVCHKKIKDGVKCKDCKKRSYKAITKKHLMILEITSLKTNEEIILKDKFNLTANGWQIYGKIIVRKN